MKKLLFIVSIFFLSITSSFAVFFIDVQGEYISTGEFQPVTGYGAGIGFDLRDDVNFLIRGSSAANTENEDELDELRYRYSFVTGGIEYIPQISFFEENRICWKNSISIGASVFEAAMKNLGGDKKSELGVIASLKTGLQYNFTQVVSPYFDLGYHKFFSTSSDSDFSIQGWQVDLGVRFYIGGSRDYNSGY